MFNIGKPETTRDAKKNEGPSPFFVFKKPNTISFITAVFKYGRQLYLYNGNTYLLRCFLNGRKYTVGEKLKA